MPFNKEQSVPPPVYVKSLFALLRALGITQQAVAQSLGVSKGLVSLWALGKTPLAKHHLRTFLTLVANAIDEAFPPAKRHYLSYDELHPSSPRRQLRHTISEHLCQWSLERYETLGLLTQDYQSAYDIIASYRGQNPAKLDSAQREKISAACRMILRVNRVLESLYQQPLESVPSDADYIPDNVLEHLWALAGWHKAWGPPPRLAMKLRSRRMMLDPTRLRTLKQFADEAPVFTLTYLRWLIANAEDNGFKGCFVKVAGRIFIDPAGVTAWLAQQQAQPQPHQRGIARKRMAKAQQSELVAV